MTAAEFRIAVLLEEGFEDDELRTRRGIITARKADDAGAFAEAILQRIGDSR